MQRAAGTRYPQRDNTMRSLFKHLTVVAAGALFCLAAGAQPANEAGRPAAVLPLAAEAPPRLVVYPPLAEPLARGVVVLQYRTENAVGWPSAENPYAVPGIANNGLLIFTTLTPPQ